MDEDNFGHDHSHKAKGRKVVDDFKHTVSGQEPLKRDYANFSAKDEKANLLTSDLDKDLKESAGAVNIQTPNEDEASQYFMQGRETKATKQMFLASNDFATHATSLQGYDKASLSAPEVIDWIVSGLPANADGKDLKKIAQVKHVVRAVCDEDSFKGTCLGTGRIQIRLNHGETADQVRLNFLRRGYAV